MPYPEYYYHKCNMGQQEELMMVHTNYALCSVKIGWWWWELAYRHLLRFPWKKKGGLLGFVARFLFSNNFGQPGNNRLLRWLSRLAITLKEHIHDGSSVVNDAAII